MADWLAAAAPLLGRGYLRLIRATCRFRLEPWPLAPDAGGGGVTLLALWHNRLLGPIVPYRQRGIGVVISRSRDGELISRVVAACGYVPLRGSSSRGGSAALRATLAHLQSGRDVVFTPDGPRGPRYRVQPGIAYAAAKSGRPVIPVGVGMTRKLVVRSWDRFQLPLPFSAVQVCFGDPLTFGAADPVASIGEAIRQELAGVTARADRLLGVTSP